MIAASIKSKSSSTTSALNFGDFEDGDFEDEDFEDGDFEDEDEDDDEDDDENGFPLILVEEEEVEAEDNEGLDEDETEALLVQEEGGRGEGGARGFTCNAFCSSDALVSSLVS